MTPTIYDAILRTVGFAPEQIKPKGLTRFSTTSRASNRDGWVRVMQDGIVRFGCWRQGVTGWWKDGAGHHQASQRDELAARKALDDEERRRQRQAIINNQLFELAHSLERQSAVGRYLVRRGLGKLSKRPLALRMASLPYFDDGCEIGMFPVMLGAITSPDGVLVGLHRTYISDEGKKAPVPQPKKLSRTSGVLAGASIKLYDPVVLDGKLTLGVSEGIETALACYLASGVPTWSCVSAGVLRGFQWPVGVQSLVIFADNDASGVGQSAARDLAGRAVAAGLECRVLVPEIVGNDWLDVFVAGGAA
ncbi:toprim domain-containing protein [Hydrogenophaga sp.]|uniref:toprim domain-containing protein n=1 Tax=Hydrogenophaga sp. TaxID=1904254 RepID=UPI0027321E7C|nr:toprim domain-containing protein [Hydrogenophaga sp.]MDP1684983.1 toprim domain-containing protein [Hydrogenophaga sp.]